jgi:hypothetical protein
MTLVSTPDQAMCLFDFRDAQYASLYTVNAGVSLERFNENDLGYDVRLPVHEFDASYRDLYHNSVLATPEIRKGLGYHQVKVGFRYDLW